ncbi:MAG: hypothetical protein DWP95_05695 [Proteobacteria bacterium]|nr:MAG: hypothetical protein DWP95_05695 [Pseudomonadota bacterium]
MNIIFNWRCIFCGSTEFTFGDRFMMLIDNRVVECDSCGKRLILREPWRAIYQGIMSLGLVIYVLIIINFGFWIGTLFCVFTFVLITGLLAFIIPVKQYKGKKIKS